VCGLKTKNSNYEILFRPTLRLRAVRSAADLVAPRLRGRGLRAPVPLELGKVGQISFALFHPAIIARLVLGADEAVRTAAAHGVKVEVAMGVADSSLHMAAVALHGLEGPGLPRRIGEKAAEIAAMRALAADRARPNPILRRRQRLGNARAQMHDTCRT
jgi:hypothetical protein